MARPAAESRRNGVSGCARFLQSRNAEAAVRFLDAFDATLALLERTPGIGGLCRFKHPQFDGMRVCPIAGFGSYLIYYRVVADEVEVVRVAHSARDLGAIFGRGEP